MTYRIRSLKSALLALLLISHAPAFGANNEAKFQRAYQAYQQHIDAEDPAKALDAAADAYKFGSRHFGKTSPNTANLAINYAALLNDSGEFKKAEKTLKGKLEVLKDHHGANSPELVTLLIELGRATFEPNAPKDGLDHFSLASNLAENQDAPLVIASQNFFIASELLKRDGPAFTERYIKRAHEIYVENLQPHDVRLGLTSYHMGLWAIGRAHHDKALDFLTGALVAFKTDDGPMGNLERTVRHRLVESYEKLALSDRATEHCLALGSSQPWSESPAPIFTKQPQYPKKAIEGSLSGEVVLEFTIDAAGFVRDPAVSRSTDPVFDETALDMIRQFRYAPRFENGEPVSTDGVAYTARFSYAPTPTAAKGASAAKGAKLKMPPLRGFSGSNGGK